MIKRLPLLIVFLLLFFLLLVFLAPHFLNFRDVQTKLITRLEIATGSKIEARELNWSWLPLPHVSLETINFSNDNVHMTIPEIQIFPHWRLIFDRQVKVGKVLLNNPRIVINSFESKSEAAQIKLPKIRIVIQNGSIQLARDLLPENMQPNAARLFNLDSEIYTAPEFTDIRLVGQTPFSEKISLKGRLNTTSLHYQLNFGIKKFSLNKTINITNGHIISPIDSLVNLTGGIEGTSLDFIKASISGEFPCFLIEPKGSKQLIKCGTFTVDMTKNGPDYQLKIDELEVQNPAVVLSGKVARTIETVNDSPEPIWLVDLSGRDLDLSAIRETVLSIWGENNIARIVCDVVKAGEARRANYYFKGPLSDFHHLEKMAITVDVLRSTIDVPHTNLHLTEAKGPIKIVKGNLSGIDLSSNLGENRGENCALFLDLTGKNDAFMLDLDLDVDVADLVTVLDNLVKSKAFRKELNKFTDVGGKAAGHLKLGNTLHNIEAQVRVDSMKAKGRYQRLSWPFEIHGGRLEVFPEKVNWNNIKSTLGPHTINTSTGTVSWSQKPFLDIARFEGRLDSSALFKELSKNKSLPKTIKKALSSIEGPFEVLNAELKGPAVKPEKWQYKFNLRARGFKWSSPLLDASVLMEKGSVLLTHKNAFIQDCKIWVREQPLSLQGDIKHTHLDKWHGWVTIEGTIREHLADLIRKKKWVPAPYFPKIPCTLKQFKISWDNGSSEFYGEILAGMGAENAPKALLDIKTSHNQLLIKELSFIDQNQRGRLMVDYWNVFPETLLLTWQGFLNRQTTHALLEKNIFDADRIEGDFSLSLADEPSSTFLKGWAKMSNAAWPWPGDFKNINIAQLDIDGQADKKVRIKKLQLDVEDRPLNITGEVSTNVKGVDFNLDLDAKEYSLAIIKRLTANLQEHLSTKTDRQEEQGNPASDPWGIKGKIAFRFNRFSAAKTDSQNAPQGTPSFIWSPMNGDITFDSVDSYTLDIQSSQLCGLDVNATYQSGADRGENIVNLFTRSESPPRFEKVLPCLGWEKSIIEGDVHVDANFSGRGDLWKEGKIDIYSFKGNIKKMATLSKVFSVVNVTDLFAGEGLPDLAKEGLLYNKIDIKTHIDNNQLIVDKAVLEGKGLNLFAKGSIDLKSQEVDGTLLVAPLKTLDAIVTNVPIFGKVIGGEDAALVAIPVAIKGSAKDPNVTIMPPQEVGKALLGIVTTTIKLPFAIFDPLLPGKSKNDDKL